MRLRYIIFYGDGSTFEGGEPEDAPVENVQAIAMEDPVIGSRTNGRFVLDSYDYYIYSNHVGGWHGTNRVSDLLDHLKVRPFGVRAVLTGRWIASEEFMAILERAKTAGDFANKSAETKYPSSGVETE